MSVDTRFFDAYLACALWTATHDDGDRSLDDFTIFDFAKPSRDQARKDCEAFVDMAGELLDGIEPSQAGHDFWLTRNRHGVGFWDRGLGERGQRLTEMAHSFGEKWVYASRDGKVHIE